MDNDFINRLMAINKKAIQERVDEWKTVGEPHATLRDEHGIVGYWNTNKGIIRIPRNPNGEYDPIRSVLISTYELSVIQDAGLSDPIELE